jgi:DNA-binding response OmpR family regulator
MRVMVFGSKRTAQKLTTSLNGKGFELTSFARVPEVMAQLKQKRFDLVVVDSSVERAEAVCQSVDMLGHVPIMIMVRERRANWDKLDSLDVDGYLPNGVGSIVLAARLQAVERRCSSIKWAEKN